MIDMGKSVLTGSSNTVWVVRTVVPPDGYLQTTGSPSGYYYAGAGRWSQLVSEAP